MVREQNQNTIHLGEPLLVVGKLILLVFEARCDLTGNHLSSFRNRVRDPNYLHAIGQPTEGVDVKWRHPTATDSTDLISYAMIP